MNNEHEIVNIKNFSFAYPSSGNQLENVNLALEKGDFALLEGQTGSGKTTLLKNILCSQYVAGQRSGEINVRAKRIGYVSQEIESQLVCDSVWHELAFALENYGVEQSIIRRRVAEISCFFGIDSWFRKKIDELSGGQKQLVNLCRALSVGPDLLLLDEPTSELDYVSEKNFLHALFRLNRELDITILLATHSGHLLADYATKQLRLDNKSEDVENQSSKNRFISRSRISNNSQDHSVAITLDDVYVRYNQDSNFVLRGLDTKINEGQITTIIGGNGCGKTTTLAAIAGLLNPIRGKIKNKFSSNQAFLPQHPSSLFVCDSVFEELQEWQKSCNYTDDDIDEILERISLINHKTQHPYDLSGGQKQLLALAKLVLTSPDLLLLDEPTKGLDTNNKLLVASILEDEKQRGSTIVLASHDLEFAQVVSDMTMQVFDGQISACERSDEFFSNNLFIKPTLSDFSEIYGRQS